MRQKRINYLVVSGFTLAMLGTAVAGIVAFSGGTGPTVPYHLVFDNVSDIKFGTQVRYEGFPIGQIEQITPFEQDGRMRFRVELGVTEGWKIPTDSVARIGASNLLSAKTIDISAGRAETVIAADGEIRAAPPVDMFSVISSVASQFGELSQSSLRPMVEDVRSLANRLGRQVETDLGTLMGSLNDAAATVRGQAKEIAVNLALVTHRLNRSTAGLERLMSPDNVASMERSIGHMEATTRNFDATSADLKVTRAKVDALLGSIDAIVKANRGNVDSSLTNVQYTLRSIATTIDSIMVNVEATSRNMSEFSRLIRQNPSLLLTGSQPEPIGRAGGPRTGRFAN